MGVINSVCTILETCIGYLDNKKTESQNKKFRYLYSFRVKIILIIKLFRNISKIANIFQWWKNLK